MFSVAQYVFQGIYFPIEKTWIPFNRINTSSNLNAHFEFRFIAKIHIILDSPLLSSKIFLLMSEVKMHYERKYRLQGQIHLKVNDRDGPQLFLSGVHISTISLPFISCFNFWYSHTDVLLGNSWVSQIKNSSPIKFLKWRTIKTNKVTAISSNQTPFLQFYQT